MKTNRFERIIAEKTGEVDRYLEKNMISSDTYPPIVHEAMRYSLFAGGKRIRPMLCMLTFDTFSGKNKRDLELTCCALEMLHTFSLIHDDLPCMDDDDFRRGIPTSHKRFGEATAVLAGDALCIYAFELLGQVNTPGIVTETAQALGTRGMIGGQVVDIESECKPVSGETLEYIHNHKTGALIKTSLRLGARIAGAAENELEHISGFGARLGLLFQIVDDILDVISTTEKLGKDAGSDQALGKATYPALFGLEKSREIAVEHSKKCKQELKQLPQDTLLLEKFTDYILDRSH
ncbi:MAG: polyprenyl synthetase family protein [bacterium]